MNYSFNIDSGKLTIADIVIHPALTQTIFKTQFAFEKWGDAQQFEYYILKQRLINRGNIFRVNVVFVGEGLKWIEISRDEKVNYPLEVLEQLKDDMVGPGNSEFEDFKLSITGAEPEFKSILIDYSKKHERI